jgi:hypothetical protein
MHCNTGSNKIIKVVSGKAEMPPRQYFCEIGDEEGGEKTKR